jgi:hypothetical protein
MAAAWPKTRRAFAAAAIRKLRKLRLRAAALGLPSFRTLPALKLLLSGPAQKP